MLLDTISIEDVLTELWARRPTTERGGVRNWSTDTVNALFGIVTDNHPDIIDAVVQAGLDGNTLLTLTYGDLELPTSHMGMVVAQVAQMARAISRADYAKSILNYGVLFTRCNK